MSSFSDDVRALANGNRMHDRPGGGRPLSELLKTKEILKGRESQRLRTFCTSVSVMLSDLDDYGNLLAYGHVGDIKGDFSARVKATGSESAAAQQIYELRWAQTAVPVFNLLSLFCSMMPASRPSYLAKARFLAKTAKVPVDGTDLSGTTALSHCFSTKPSFDLEYAQLLYDAGGDVNNRNRYGGLVAHEIVQVRDWTSDKRPEEALAWFLAHGGSVDIRDGDGVSPRYIAGILRSVLPRLTQLIEEEDKRRGSLGDGCCRLCGRDAVQLLRCAKCKKARYCSPSVRSCQKWDWPRHKKDCKA